MAEPSPFPWGRVMQFAFGTLRLSPEAFWSMTMREMNCAMRQNFGDETSLISRANMENLMQKHPDKVKHDH